DAGLELGATRARAVVRDLRILVHVRADAVADERADDAEAVGLADVLDGRRDVTDPPAGVGRADAGHHRQARRVDQLAGLRADVADDERPGAVAVPALEDRADVDGHERARPDRPVAGDAVDDLAVDRDAGAGRKGARALAVATAAEVALERRDRAGLDDVPLREPVQVAGGHAGLELRLDEREHLGDDAPRPP